MTTPLSDTRLTEIRADAERRVHPAWRAVNHTWMLLNEVDRLRAELVAARGEAADAVQRFERLHVAYNVVLGERDQARAQVHAASTVKCWVNEDGRRFVFADDLAFALGYTPTADPLVDDGQPMADAEIEAVEYEQRALGAGQ